LRQELYLCCDIFEVSFIHCLAHEHNKLAWALKEINRVRIYFILFYFIVDFINEPNQTSLLANSAGPGYEIQPIGPAGREAWMAPPGQMTRRPFSFFHGGSASAHPVNGGGG
jgi:hypothetical protein